VLATCRGIHSGPCSKGLRLLSYSPITLAHPGPYPSRLIDDIYGSWCTRVIDVLTFLFQASSDIETVNSLWKGLGYYSRAARLLHGAQYVVKDLDGQMPTNAEDMQAKIPGIGRYSAGAICSIAYNQRVPVVGTSSFDDAGF
jgi:hypothetical protein